MAITPYYEEAGITIYCGDAREIVPAIAPEIIISDPPYGIAYRHGRCTGSQATKFYNETSKVHGDDEPFDPSFLLGASALVLWGANNYARHLPHSGGWMVWDKRLGTVVNDHSDCELAWTNLMNTARVYYHMWDGFRRGPQTGMERVHPTEKPINLMKWCISFAPDEGVIVDPFMGSGTTLRAAKDLGRKAIGIEIEERYVEIAIKRLQQEVLPLCMEESSGN